MPLATTQEALSHALSLTIIPPPGPVQEMAL